MFNQLQKHFVRFAGWCSIKPAIRVSNNIVFVTYPREDTEYVLILFFSFFTTINRRLQVMEENMAIGDRIQSSENRD